MLLRKVRNTITRLVRGKIDAAQLAAIVGEPISSAEFDFIQTNFSYDYYNFYHPDVPAQGLDAMEHYFRYGWREGRRPSDTFDPVAYIDLFPELKDRDVNLLLHYARRMARNKGLPASVEVVAQRAKQVASLPVERTELNWSFDPDFYRATYADVAKSPFAPLAHYQLHGMREGRYPSALALAFDRNLILSSPDFFDVEHYSRLIGADSTSANLSAADLIDHYLLSGAYKGWQPNGSVDGGFLMEYYQHVNLSPNPAVCLLTVHGSLWHQFANRRLCAERANLIANSIYFEPDAYEPLTPRKSMSDRAIEYLLIGEYLGKSISKGFDPNYYAQRYPDVKLSGMCLLEHFISFGSKEGRQARRVEAETAAGDVKFDPAKQTIVIVTHEASLSGAPILAQNVATKLSASLNVVVALLAGGKQIASFASVATHVIGPVGKNLSEQDAESIVDAALSIERPQYVIINSIESSMVAKAFSNRFIPSIMLIHEFSEYTRPKEKLIRALFWSTAVVFPANLVRESAINGNYGVPRLNAFVLAQGKSIVKEEPDEHAADIAKFNRQFRGRSNARVVLGAGSVQIRKGIDLFIQCATEFFRSDPNANVRFVWVGGGYEPTTDVTYSVYLADQVQRAGLQDKMLFVDEVDNIEAVYGACDVFLLSSRLDPFPNVAIDVAMTKVPIVCFDRASGVAEWMSTNAETKRCVAHYFDCAGAARIIQHLLSDEAYSRFIGATLAKLAQEKFDMSAYARALDRIGADAGNISAQEQKDVATLIKSPDSIDLSLYRHPQTDLSLPEAARRFVRQWAAFGASGISAPYLRKPHAGFDVAAFAAAHKQCLSTPFSNPLALALAQTEPSGAAFNKVIEFEDAAPDPATFAKLQAALHIHIYFADLAPDIFTRLNVNKARLSLLITTDAKEKTAIIEKELIRFGLNGEIVVTPNRGRDIGAFLTGLKTRLRHYDVVGHVHTKKSIDIGDEETGQIWRMFLNEHMLGGVYPAADAILKAFASDEKLGLVFPEDPYLGSWDKNLVLAKKLWAQMGYSAALPASIDYPTGNMFWIRSTALAPLLSLDLGWDDYPPEPLPYDGTILHAIERLLPLIVEQAGFEKRTVRARPWSR